MIKSTDLANAVHEMIDANYCLGDTSKGWDCLNSLLSVYRKLGFTFPESMGGIDESNYARIWNEDNDRARAVFTDFLMGLGEPVDPSFSVRGDLLIFKGAELPAFPAISLGSGHMLIVFQDGVRVEPVSRWKKYLISVRRLVK
jgi:hypothetical protein